MALRKTLTAFAPFVRQPGPRALLAGNAISRFGDALDTVAFGWLVYRLTGSTLMMGMLYTVNALPGLIFGLAGGLLADRRPPARTFALLCALRGALVMLIAVLALLDRCPVYMLFVFTALNSTCEALGSPAAQKLPSLLLPAPSLDGYLGLQQGLQTGAELLGYAMSGFVIALLGMGHALLVDAMTFLACAALVLRAGRYAQAAQQAARQEETPRSALLEGIRHIRRVPALVILVLYEGFVNLMLAPFNALNIVYVGTVLGRGPETVGVMGVTFMAGTLLGGLCAALLASTAPRLRLTLATLLLGTGYALLALPPLLPGWMGLPLTLTACVLAGLGLPIAITTAQAVALRTTPAHLRGRVLGLLLVVTYAATPLGSAAAGVLGSLVELPALFGACGLMVLLCALPLLLCNPLRQLDAPPAP
ncbi:MAG TPA: MFS transporter [Candidatus Onthenecus intestinigallinarum]|uniref:MFS transporter n=1 Tax=Candidatus Onthenecus intestinigallinarum TaxID=2840875 RepID=A0A9D1CRI3_9FIRM|nr:MFS transporter [Candidatus Onthenecus intestinigallinarum]